MPKEAGRLFYIMGASGVGKDALIEALRAGTTDEVHVACRYTTRPEARPGPLEIGLAQADFERLDAAGAFWFEWSSYDVRYSIRRREADRLAHGWQVVVNGSRAYLETARRRCPGLVPVLVTCDDEHELRRRLFQRGREDRQAIEARIARGRALATSVPADTAIIDNAGSLAVAARCFLSLVQTA